MQRSSREDRSIQLQHNTRRNRLEVQPHIILPERTQPTITTQLLSPQSTNAYLAVSSMTASPMCSSGMHWTFETATSPSCAHSTSPPSYSSRYPSSTPCPGSSSAHLPWSFHSSPPAPWSGCAPVPHTRCVDCGQQQAPHAEHPTQIRQPPLS